MSDVRAVARAIDACRRGWPVTVTGDDGTLVLLAIETSDGARLATLPGRGPRDLLLSPERAVALDIAGAAVPGASAIRLAGVPWLDLDAATALADPALDRDRTDRGTLRPIETGGDDAARAAIKLARLAGLLPAFFVGDGVPTDPTTVVADAIFDYDAPSRLQIASRARLPIARGGVADIVAFRSAEEAVEHVALIVGTPIPDRTPLVRLHSECLTGDVFGSLKCDCGPQLDHALAAIVAEGWGVLLYLRQEGRGIGLVNKLRAYALQDSGLDTVDANLRLGFAIDTRDFGTAARMLDLIGIDRIRLLTNNPAKVAGLAAAGIAVAEQLPHRIPANAYNAGYLDTKRDRTGHRL